MYTRYIILFYGGDISDYDQIYSWGDQWFRIQDLSISDTFRQSYPSVKNIFVPFERYQNWSQQRVGKAAGHTTGLRIPDINAQNAYTLFFIYIYVFPFITKARWPSFINWFILVYKWWPTGLCDEGKYIKYNYMSSLLLPKFSRKWYFMDCLTGKPVSRKSIPSIDFPTVEDVHSKTSGRPRV